MLQAINHIGFHFRAKNGWLRRAMPGLAVSLFMLLAGDEYGLEPARDILQYNCQTWGRQNGLPANGISSITQTEDGYLWLGTAIGLVRFDGTEFNVVDLGELSDAWSSGIVNGLSSAQKGGLCNLRSL